MDAGFVVTILKTMAATEMSPAKTNNSRATRWNPNATAMKKITVLLADDHTIVREGFCQMLAQEADFEVVGQVADGRQAIALALKLHPDVVLMDIAMPRLNGLEATRQLLKALPSAKVIILSSHNDDASIENAIQSGAAGFLLKQTSARDVCHAIREVHKGKTVLSPLIAKRFRRIHPQFSVRERGLKPSQAKLTSRQMEVLQLIAEGKANKEMAAELGIGLKTVEKHREHVMQKLDIHDTAGLTRYAISAGIIESRGHLTIK
jgi:DNA-binding NarL/FixJ family response regulator